MVQSAEYRSSTQPERSGSVRQHLISPIKLLMSGVMPIIFAGVIMSLPATLDMFIDATKHQRLHAVLSVFTTESWLYCLLYVLLIAAFNFFYIEIQFDAVSMAGSLRKQSGTIPGIRPGTPTTDMLNKTLHRMALTGSFYLAAIALTPMVFSAMSGGTDFFRRNQSYDSDGCGSRSCEKYRGIHDGPAP